MTTATIDLAAIKGRQQQTWASGDYGSIAAKINVISERLCDSLALRAGDRVLDVATGTGNAAIAAARSGCHVIGVDYAQSLLERARVRAAAEAVDAEFVEGDAEALAFPDGSFDVVTSVVGVMFAPDQPRAAAELLRVCRPGGTIALASWTPDGFIGDLFSTTAKHVPPPAGLTSPMQWGTEEGLRDLLGDGVSSLELTSRTYEFRFPSAQAFVDFFRRDYGPTLKAFAALEPDAQVALETDLVQLVAEGDRHRDGRSVGVPAAYLQAIATRR
jgi:SAM-dependent methyltransferase